MNFQETNQNEKNHEKLQIWIFMMNNCPSKLPKKPNQ